MVILVVSFVVMFDIVVKVMYVYLLPILDFDSTPCPRIKRTDYVNLCLFGLLLYNIEQININSLDMLKQTPEIRTRASEMLSWHRNV